MRDGENAVEESKVESKSLDFDDACGTSGSACLSTTRIRSSSPWSSKGRQNEVDDVDSDCDFVGPPVPPEVDKEINESPVREPGRNGEYDRETILHQLADLASSESERRMILGIIEFKIGCVKPGAKASTKFCEISKNEDMTTQDRRKSLVDGLRESLEAVPDSIMHFLTGWFRPTDHARSSDQKPDWLDMDKLRRGQKFAQNHVFSLAYSEVIGIMGTFSFDDGLKPLIISGNSVTSYKAYKRYLSTAVRTWNWYTQDPWTKGTDAWKDILAVRALHAAISQRLDASTIEETDGAAKIPNAWCPARENMLKDFSEACEAPVIGQCPYRVGRNNPHRPKSINQFEMAAVQWGIVGLATLYPRSVGIHNATDEDVEAFCHLWRSIGYQLGMEDEYNLCRGTLEEIRQRNRDFLDAWIKPNLREITPEWEHMGRCLVTGTSAILPLVTYESALSHLLEIIELKMPRFYASLSYKDWIVYNLISSLFNYGTKLPRITGLLNTFLIVVLNQAKKQTPKELGAVQIKLSNRTGNYNYNNNNKQE